MSLKINVLTRVHLGHISFLDTWMQSLIDNKQQIGKIVLWLSDKDISLWYYDNRDRFLDMDIPICCITNYNSDPISCLSIINDHNYGIGAVLDFDDIWLPNHLSYAFHKTKNFKEKTFFGGRSNFVDKNVRKILGTHMHPSKKQHILLYTPIAFSSMVWMPGSINVDVNYNRMIDQSLIYQAFVENNIVIGDEVTVQIRKHNNSMSENLIGQVIDRFRFALLSKNFLILLNLIFATSKKFKLKMNKSEISKKKNCIEK